METKDKGVATGLKVRARIEKLEYIKNQIDKAIGELPNKESQGKIKRASIEELLTFQRKNIIDLIRITKYKSQSNID